MEGCFVVIFFGEEKIRENQREKRRQMTLLFQTDRPSGRFLGEGGGDAQFALRFRIYTATYFARSYFYSFLIKEKNDVIKIVMSINKYKILFHRHFPLIFSYFLAFILSEKGCQRQQLLQTQTDKF